MSSIEPNALARQLLSDIQKRAKEAGLSISAEILPRLEEVTTLLAETSILRLAGTPDEQMEQVLQARFKNLAAATSLELGGIVRETVRGTMMASIRYIFGLIGLLS